MPLASILSSLPTTLRSPLATLTVVAASLVTHADAKTTPGHVTLTATREGYSVASVKSVTAGLYGRVTPPTPKYGVDRYRLRVATTDERGRPLSVAALLYIPRMPAGQAAPLYVMGAGTTGLADACAPTRENVSRDNWGDYEAHMTSYAAQGYVSILPDWAHFDDPSKPQPYFVAASEGRILLDAARAAQAFLRQRAGSVRTDGNVFLAGYSQGGHAAFAAADLAAKYAPELRIRGVIGYAPAMDVATLMRERPALGPYLARSYAAYYGLDATRIISGRWGKTLPTYASTMCVTRVYQTYPNEANSIYRPEFRAALHGEQWGTAYADLARILRMNTPGFNPSGRHVPALVVTGLADPIVTAEAQKTFVQKSCVFGRAVAQRAYAGVHHFQARQYGFTDTLAWMKDVRAGRTPNECSEARFASVSSTKKRP